MNPTSSLTEIVRALARGWKVIVISVVVCVGAAVGYVKLSDPSYEATAVLTVEPLGSSPLSNSSSSVDMDTEQVIAGSTSVLAGAVDKIPGSSVSELQDSVSISVPKGSRVLQFTFTATTAQAAADGANAIAESYQTQRTDNAQRIMDEASANLNDLISQLEKSLSNEDMDSNSRRVTELQISSIQERLATLASATFYGGNLVSPATPPTSESGPGLKIMGAAGVAVGLLLGFFLALIRDRLRRERELQERVAVAGGPPPATTAGAPAGAESDGGVNSDVAAESDVVAESVAAAKPTVAGPAAPEAAVGESRHARSEGLPSDDASTAAQPAEGEPATDDAATDQQPPADPADPPPARAVSGGGRGSRGSRGARRGQKR